MAVSTYLSSPYNELLHYFVCITEFLIEFQAAVRSSRRKRSQYVAGLRDEVDRLHERRRECQEENGLLTQLHGLWSRLVTEVESEIQVIEAVDLISRTIRQL